MSEIRKLGRSGLDVSVAGLGCNNFGMRIGYEEAERVVHAALDAGVVFFDTADMYGGGRSEEFLGKALGPRRSRAVIATKFGAMRRGPNQRGGSRQCVLESVEQSLQRLGTDWIDLYQLHYPDPATPIEETLRALDDLVRLGKVRYVGSSNFAGWQIAEAEHVAREAGVHRFVSSQNEWNLLSRGVEAEVIPACEHYGIAQLPYFPLASGMLTGKYRRDEGFPEGSRLAAMRTAFAAVATPENFDRVEALERFARERGHALLDLALSWLASQPCVASVIAGATRPDQVAANVAATSWKLTAEELAAVDGLLSR